MALAKFVVGTTVTLPAGTGTSGTYGTETWADGSAGTTQWCNGMAATFRAGEVVFADSTSPGASAGNGPQQLYIALNGAGANLRAWVDGQDDVGHAALSN